MTDSDPQVDAASEAAETTPEQQGGDAAVESDAAPAETDPEPQAGAEPTPPETVTQDAIGQARVTSDADLPDDEATLLGDGSQPNPYGEGTAQEDYR